MPAFRVGLLFDHDFDAAAHRRLEAGGGATRWRFERGGFDLFAFPEQLRLAGFDLERFAAAQARRARLRGWAGVVSHQEHFGALAAALVAEAAGLPGTSPESVLACQDKLHARRVLARIAPESSPAFAALAWEGDTWSGDPVAPPFFAKPRKSAFSVLARCVHDAAELRALQAAGRAERWLARLLVDPFDRVLRRRLPQAQSAHGLIVEALLHGPQYNLDGYVWNGEAHALGVVDALMYPGTLAFQRWQFPSVLPAPAAQRALALATRFLAEIGFTQGFFSMEFVLDPATGRIGVIEFNPRLSSQFGDLYRRVLGLDPHAMALAMAVGEDPRGAPRVEPVARVAASLVWRAFRADAPPPPSRARRAGFAAQMPDALLFSFPRSRRAIARELRWVGSHRYGTVHLGAADPGELRARAGHAARLLGWPDAPYSEAVEDAFAATPTGLTPVPAPLARAQAAST
jgi:hypothetical protein